MADPFGGDDTDAGRALVLWDIARNRLEPYEATWRRADAIEDNTPDLAYCRSIVDRYEQAKRLDHRVDFTDLLSHFAGWYCSPDGAEKCEPDGEAPDLPVWCFDEQQDTSALLHAVCQRLVEQPSVRYVYVAGDDAQSIYGWAGSDPHWFREGWPLAKSRTLSQSYRCPARVVELGEGLLRGCNDAAYYNKRVVAGVKNDGGIDYGYSEELTAMVDPRESWLLLARTNFFASRMAKLLDGEGTPWVPTRGNSPWNAPVRGQAIAAMRNLKDGVPIDGLEWQSILKNIKSKVGTDVLLERGTKARFDAMTAEQAQSEYSWIQIDALAELGATQTFIDGVRSGAWYQWIDFAERTANAIKTWGKEAVDSPGIRIGTIHSAKGAEADNVALLTSIPSQCYKAAQSPDGFDEETRVKYVGVTRARHRLVILDEPKAKYRWRIEG
jgi:DNA helicase-2/ATP-dependent DNA helicase PcrA